VSVNTFHFNPGGPMTEAKAQEMENRIVNAYGHLTAGLAIHDIYGGQMSGAWSVRIYDLTDPEPRVPFYENDESAFTPSGSALPAEVAICVSYQAIKQSGNNQASRRGRVYLGPLGDVSVNLADSSDVAARPTTAVLNTCIQGIAQLDVVVADSAVKWVVYSPKLDAFAEVDNLWVDNAFDTQRRRGERPTARTVVAL
jgi:hypothetical protein